MSCFYHVSIIQEHMWGKQPGFQINTSFIDQGREDIREQIFTLIDKLIIQHRAFGFYDSVLFCTKMQF